MGTKTPTDSVYRAAILTAGDLDSITAPTRVSAGVALAATLERHGVRLAHAPAKAQSKPVPGILELEDSEGIVISVTNEERPADWMITARQNRWRRAHLVHFAPRALSIRTLAI